MWWDKKYTVTQHHEQSTLDRTKTCFEKRILPYLGIFRLIRLPMTY